MIRYGVPLLMLAGLVFAGIESGIIKFEPKSGPARQWGYHSRMTSYQQTNNGLEVVKNEETHVGPDAVLYLGAAAVVIAVFGIAGHKILEAMSRRQRQAEAAAKAKQDPDMAILESAFR